MFLMIAAYLDEKMKAMNSPKRRKSSKGKKGNSS
jgi:hypothetical protein